jgi:23S rRNA pseudouridine1911/1915/1917 synthase
MASPGSRSANYTAGEGGVRALHLTIPLEMAGLRLDQALARLLPGESRSRLARLIEGGHVKVDGAAAASRRKMKSGEAVDVALVARPVDLASQPEAIGLAVVHEDADLLVIDKPAGLVVHPGSGNWQGTMLNALLHHAPATRDLPRAGIVHRLDKDTSGLLVVAKNEAARADLVRQLAARTVKRTYLALVRGRVEGEGSVDAPIGRHPAHRTRMAVVANGKPAVTHYRVRESFERHTLLECELETGRTHQIRVHLRHLGAPLLGDARYGGPRRVLETSVPRVMLHARRLTLPHPATGAPLALEAPVPEDFLAVLRALAPAAEGAPEPP